MRFEVIGSKVTEEGARQDILRWTPIVWGP